MAEKEFSSGGIVIKRTGPGLKVLLIKDGYGHWTWPKGNIEKDESSQDAAIREIWEETGVKNLEMIDKIDAIHYFYRLKSKLIFKTVYLYLFEAKGSERLKALESEIEDAKWLPPAEALEKIEYKGAKKILNKAVGRFKKVN
jgi:8-oxo-dGTP pyrophosphatase MutT (NUDIX family)